MSRTCVIAAIVLTSGVSGVARAQDAFEIQVYDTETAERGEPGLEMHVNQHVGGYGWGSADHVVAS